MLPSERVFLNCCLYHRRGIVDGKHKPDKKRNIVFGQNSKGIKDTQIYFIKFFKGDAAKQDCKAKIVFPRQNFCGITEWVEAKTKQSRFSYTAIFTKNSDPFVIYSHCGSLIESNDHKSLIAKIRREMSMNDREVVYQSWDVCQGDNSNSTHYQLHLTPYNLALTNTNNYNIDHHSWVTFVWSLGDIQQVTQEETTIRFTCIRNLTTKDKSDCDIVPQTSTMRLIAIGRDDGAKCIIDSIHKAQKHFRQQEKHRIPTAQYHFGPVKENSHQDPQQAQAATSKQHSKQQGLIAQAAICADDLVGAATASYRNAIPEVPRKCPGRIHLPEKPAQKTSNTSCATKKVKPLPEVPGPAESVKIPPIPPAPANTTRQEFVTNQVIKPKVTQRTKTRDQSSAQVHENVELKKQCPPVPHPLILKKSQSIDDSVHERVKIPTTRKRSFPQDNQSQAMPDVRVLLRNNQADRATRKSSVRKSVVAIKAMQNRRSSSLDSIHDKIDEEKQSPFVDICPSKQQQSQLKYAIDKCIKAAHIIKAIKQEGYTKEDKAGLPPYLKDIFKEMAEFYDADLLPSAVDKGCISGWDPIYYTLMKKQNRTPIGPDTLYLNIMQRPQLYFRLYDRTGVTKNWKHLAGILGLSCEVIDLIESIAFNSGCSFTPAELLFNHWQCLHNKFQKTPFEPKYLCTLDNLKLILAKMKRFDLLDMLKETKIQSPSKKGESHSAPEL
ncbi:uncharacterized protein LOC141903969 [Tubulanus polymorphus]|uniref:uncharacterized protein LOC141903969 n=1 Tax=Tubulanus polymorphus TaxID=672921 RepID=UPI003DA424D8